MTGIDRVELAYLAALQADDVPLFGLIRSGAGWLLLDGAGCGGLQALATGKAALGKPDLLSRLVHRGNPLRAAAESSVRRLAMARGARPGLARLLRQVPKGASYLNVGHANLTARSLSTLRLAGLTVTVLIHDTIPLDHPEFARPDTVEPFRAKLAAVSAHATRVIHITDAARQKTEAQLARLGRTPPGLTAAIGVSLPHPDPTALPPGLDLTPPYFVTLGTIEPRKNHALLLDIWEELGPLPPRLYIVGNRGWADAALLARLEALPPGGPVQELRGLSDGAVAALLQGATALLAPSHAEGFGLPPLEAASLGIPVIAADLAVTKELMADKAVYLDLSDRYSWMQTILRQTQTAISDRSRETLWRPPDWAAHFKKVLNLA
jgi:glycosyltransferase involved in cell wall biosynthesis